MAVDVGSAIGYLDLDINGFLTGLKTAQSEANLASKNIVDGFGQKLQGAGKKLSSIGGTLTKTVTLPLLGVGAAGLKVATDFEKGMSEVKAISGAVGDEFDDLREKAIELGADTAFSSIEVANAMTEMAKAGWNSRQIIDGMGGVLDAAAASGEGLGTVSTILADAITGFGLEASDSSKVADLLTQAANAGTIGISDLGESFKYIAPIAASMGFSIEDVTTAISAMSMSGIKGSSAGTALRGMLVNLNKPTDDMADSMDLLGVQIADSEGNFYSLDNILGQLRTGMSGLTDEEKAYHASVLAGKSGMSGLLSILNLTEEQYNAIAVSMDDAGGVAKKTAEIMQDNLASKTEQLGGALESLAIKLSDLVIPKLTEMVTKVTGLIDKFSELDTETQTTILKVAGFALVLGPVLTVVGKLTTGIGGLISVGSKIPGMFAAISAPVAVIVIAIGVLVAAFINLWQTNEGFRNSMIEIWDGLKLKFQEFTQGIVDKINELGFNFTDIVDMLKFSWEQFCNMLAPIFETTFSIISTLLGSVMDILMGILDIFIGLFTGDWEQLWEGVKGIFGGIWDAISGTFKSVIKGIKGQAEVIFSWFDTSWEELWEGVKTFFSNIWDSIILFFTSIPGKIQAIVTDILNRIKTWGSNMINSAKETGTNFVNGIINFFQELPGKIGYIIGVVLGHIIKWAIEMPAKAKEMAENFLEQVVTFFKELPVKVFLFITETFYKVTSWAKDMKDKAYQAGKDFLTNVIDFVKQLPGKVWDFLGETIAKLAKWVIEMGAKGWEAVTSLIDNVKSAAKDLPSKVMSIGTDIVNGVWNGIKGAADAFKKKVNSFFSGIVSGVKSVLGINSPSKVFEDEIGKMLPPGVSNGFTKALPKAMSVIEDELNHGINNLTTDDVSMNVDKFGDTFKQVFDSITIWFNSFDKKLNGSIINMINNLRTLMDAGRLVINSDGTLGYIGYNGLGGRPVNPGTDANPGANDNNNSGGDTFNFYSPKPLSEVEAARQMKNAKRDLSEGF